MVQLQHSDTSRLQHMPGEENLFSHPVLIYLTPLPSKEKRPQPIHTMQEDIVHLVRQYLRGQLTQEERAAFEQQLTQDQEFAAIAVEAASTLLAIERQGDRELEANLTEYAREILAAQAPDLRATFSSPEKERRIALYSRLARLAAVLIGILAIALPLWLLNRPDSPLTTPEELYATNFTVPAVPQTRSSEEAEAWRRAYAKGDYTSAARQLEDLLEDPAGPARSETLLYLGICRLDIGKPEAAIAALSQVSPESYDWETAQWYTALALLKLDKQKELRQLLQDITGQTNHPYAAKAKQLLEQLPKGN